jgi:exonuclease III
MKIICQNVYWFQGYPAEVNRDVINLKAYDGLLKIYQSIQADIILLQEIQSEKVAQKIALDLGMKYIYNAGEEIKWYGGVVLFHPNLNISQVFNTFEETFQRVYQIVSVSFQDKKINLCNVHLPSDAQLSPAMAEKKRKVEMSLLIGLKPDLICGDFNENEGSSRQLFDLLESNHYYDAILHNNQNNKATKIKDKRGDFIFVKNELKQLVDYFYTVDLKQYKMDKNEATFLSDHFPLVIGLKQ